MIDFLELIAKDPVLSRELGELAARYGFEFATAESGHLKPQESDGSTDEQDAEHFSVLGDIRQLDALKQQQRQQLEAMQAFSNMMQAYHDAASSIINSTK
jgi:hypothetical protein